MLIYYEFVHGSSHIMPPKCTKIRTPTHTHKHIIQESRLNAIAKKIPSKNGKYKNNHAIKVECKNDDEITV